MRTLKNSLPLLFLAAVFSFNECKRQEAAAVLNINGGVLPEVTAIMLKSKSPHVRRVAAQQLAAQQLDERNAQDALGE